MRRKALMASLLGALALCQPRLSAGTDKPKIDINFDDDASSLEIAATWDEGGKPKRETFSFGKDMYLTFDLDGKQWKQGKAFHSRNWEAYLSPSGNGFLLMEREYDGKAFSNLGLRYFEYAPKHRTLNLAAANGSPWWSPDGAKLALVEVSAKKSYKISLYDMSGDFKQLSTQAGLSEAEFKKQYGDFSRARSCDDSLPCEAPPVPTLEK